MIYTDMTIKAMNLAYTAHHGQKDRGGVPYVFHPYHLAEQMEDEISATAALLHDVVEDTDITLEQLREEFPPEVTEAVDLLTHRDEVPYLDYVRNLRKNPVAVKVKLADLVHNSDPQRKPLPGTEEPEVTAERLEKYEKAKQILNL